MSGLIIEGVCATGKSTILKALTNKDWYIEKQTKIQLSEYLTERIVENLKPTVDKRVELLQEYVDIFETVHNNFYNSRFKNTKSLRVSPFFIAERFHLTHAVEAKDFNLFRNIDVRLKNMDFKLVVLIMKEEVFRDRIEDTFPRRPETWKNYCLSFGGIGGACERYINMQRTLLEYAKQTSIPTKIIDTTAMEWEKYVQDIENFIN